MNRGGNILIIISLKNKTKDKNWINYTKYETEQNNKCIINSGGEEWR